MIQKLTLTYKVTLPLQLDLREGMTSSEIQNAFEFQGQTFLEMALMEQDLHEEGDETRKKLGLIQTLGHGVPRVVELLSDNDNQSI